MKRLRTNQRRGSSRFAGLVPILVGLALLPGCGTATLTAQNSVNPVLLGPVHRIGGAQSSSTRPEIGDIVIRSEEEKSAGGSSSSSRRSAASEPDFEIVMATSGSLEPQIALSEASCGGYFLFLIVGGIVKSWCEAKGTVIAPPRSAHTSPNTPPAGATTAREAP